MRPSRLALTAATAAAFALVLVGCSGGSSGDELSYEDSPLSKYLAAAYGGDLSEEEQQQQFDEQQKQREEIIAQCMSEEGFEYTPQESNGVIITSSDEDSDEPEYGTREFVEQYGFGAIHWPGDSEMAQPTEETTNPNDDYVMSLSESEQTAYYETLYGPGPSEEEINEDGSYEYNWETAGCDGQAQHEVNGDNPYEDEEFADLVERMNNLYTDVQSSEDTVALNREWASCMTDKGHDGPGSPTEASQVIYDEMNENSEDMYDPETGMIDDDNPKVKELQEKEIALATADLDCREKLSYDKKTMEIQFAAEEAFIAENKAELEAFKTAMEQAN